jgi:CheY-like chemotaxis protein
VDDQRDSRDMIAALLEEHGALVIPCDSAEAALRVLAAARVDVMVADIGMPEVDGYELLRRVRERVEGLPALAVSAYARPEDRRRALVEGYSDFCAKPIDAARVLRAVHQALPASRKGAADHAR